VLKVEGLSVSYGPVRALRDVSLEVGDGELVAILGANGAGKSTLLQTVSGLVRAERGTISLAGERIAGAAPERVARLGVAHVPEGRRIFPGLTVEQNLVLGATARRGRDGLAADFARVYELFPVLADRRAQQGWSLSGGQQQMLAVGRALMSRPRLLMLDEPSLGLAPMLVRQVLSAVRTICDAGTATLLVEQNARGALRIADRACVLRTGEIVHQGSAAELGADDRMRETYLGA
jgi:branched-chain amino acid transport system ATP-binding protein